MDDVAHRFDFALRWSGRPLRQVAGATGIAAERMHAIIRGDAATTDEEQRIAQALGVSPEWLFRGRSGGGPRQRITDLEIRSWAELLVLWRLLTGVPAQAPERPAVAGLLARLAVGVGLDGSLESTNLRALDRLAGIVAVPGREAAAGAPDWQVLDDASPTAAARRHAAPGRQRPPSGRLPSQPSTPTQP